MKACCIVAGVFALLIAAAVAGALAFILTRHKAKPAKAKANIGDEISKNAKFPNGSYLVSVNSMDSGPMNMAPQQPNASVLINNLGINVDNSSFVAETGRLSYFYVALPPQMSTGNKKSNSAASSIAALFQPTAIGIRFGDASTVNVVPLSLASDGQGSGMKYVGTLDDDSHVYAIQAVMPASMCTGSAAAASLPVACGSVCDAAPTSACASSSCLPCDGLTVNGYDTPVTRRYMMGSTAGSLQFSYETYRIQDRITVVYEGNMVFDSGCLGTGGEVGMPISFNGSSQELRVDVEPDCAGDTGTAWYFTLPCLTCGSASSESSIRQRADHQKSSEWKKALGNAERASPSFKNATKNQITKKLKMVTPRVCFDGTYYYCKHENGQSSHCDTPRTQRCLLPKTQYCLDDESDCNYAGGARFTYVQWSTPLNWGSWIRWTKAHHEYVTYRGFVYEFGEDYDVVERDIKDPGYKYASGNDPCVTGHNQTRAMSSGTSTCSRSDVLRFTTRWGNEQEFHVLSTNCQMYAKYLIKWLLKGCTGEMELPKPNADSTNCAGDITYCACLEDIPADKGHLLAQCDAISNGQCWQAVT